MKPITLWIGWVFLLVIYVATIAAHCAAREYYYLFFAALSFGCCCLLFVSEGFEISFAMLFPMRNHADPDIRNSLEGLDAEFILSQRQVIVALTITILSLISVFDWIYIPGVGRVHAHWATAWFSGLFVSITVLWFCQVLPKRLAARSTESFWRLSRWLLKPIVAAGRLVDLPAPANNLVDLWELAFPTRDKRSRHEAALLQPGLLWESCDCPVCNASANLESASRKALDVCNCELCRQHQDVMTQ